MIKGVCRIKFKGQELIEIGNDPEIFKYVKEQLENKSITIRIKLRTKDGAADRHYLRSDFEYFEFNWLM